MKNIKKRAWALVCYPESLPDNWQDFLEKTGLEIAVSPLHDKDINPDNTPKKAHYHIILVYQNPTTYKNVKENICDYLNCPSPQPLESVKGYYRYLTHRDNPEKYQYNENEITTLNGFDINDMTNMTMNELCAYLNKITDFIEELQIIEYRDLIVLLKKDEELRFLLPIAQNKTTFINAYIKSLKYKNLKKGID